MEINKSESFNLKKYSISGCIQALEMATNIANQKLILANSEEDLIRVKEMLEYAMNQANIEINKINLDEKEETFKK